MNINNHISDDNLLIRSWHNLYRIHWMIAICLNTLISWPFIIPFIQNLNSPQLMQKQSQRHVQHIPSHASSKPNIEWRRPQLININES